MNKPLGRIPYDKERDKKYALRDLFDGVVTPETVKLERFYVDYFMGRPVEREDNSRDNVRDDSGHDMA